MIYALLIALTSFILFLIQFAENRLRFLLKNPEKFLQSLFGSSFVNLICSYRFSMTSF